MKLIKTVLPIVVLIFFAVDCKEKNKTVRQEEKEVKNAVTFFENDEAQKVDILVDGKLFTSYLYADDLPVLKKPVLYPIIAANGNIITRGYPLDPRPNERTDHPHHIGSWLNYGEVNDLDFWGNSDAIPEKYHNQMGTIKNEKIVSLKNQGNSAELTVDANWLKPDGSALLKEVTHFTFCAGDDRRTIDRVTTLTALDAPVLFNDTKEGMFAIRVARQLEHPSDKPVTLSDVHGNKTDVPILDNTGVTGHYLSSEGIEGEDVWGTRAKWVALYGTIDKKDVTVVIMDRPSNLGYPTYWHARGYGLFAANPLGQKVFSDGKEEMNLSLEPGKSVTFDYRIAIYDGKVDKLRLEEDWNKFAGN
ncbi:PmoA family protein [Flavobacteriaceae bacterium F89]|uniref:PmoA family protein n=1 Tax=Cerina litoralis TaxID=2874477 RepID=A0AAE3EVG9_9FLAO|nr:PmoA family protein [Cerina litoralis]MCG2460416.1 PmoA family protein [Cerina litoralis]